MTDEQKAAYINGQSVAMLVEALGMNAENQYRKSCDVAPAYREDDFACLPVKYGVHHNAIIAFFHT